MGIFFKACAHIAPLVQLRKSKGVTEVIAREQLQDSVVVGPMLQGLRKPVNDLSRGATVEDIVYTIALTAVQSG